MTTKPLYIFDLDGTLALIEHRRHFVTRPAGAEKGWAPDWNAFNAACDDDLPNWPVIGTFLQLYSCGCDVRIWSGRMDNVKGQTLMWLFRHTSLSLVTLERMLQMRPTGDFTPDHQMKRKWLNALPPIQRNRLAAVFDDRDSVVSMWRNEGVACFQVAPGDF